MIRIAQYKGKSLTSKIIKFKTRGVYSHTAIMLDDNKIVEAWQGSNEVRIIESLSDGHKPGTEVDIYYLDATQSQQVLFVEFVMEQLGKKYDYLGILGFVFNRNFHGQDSWFCSELFMAACVYAGIVVLKNTESWQASPSLITKSPKLYRVESLVTV